MKNYLKKISWIGLIIAVSVATGCKKDAFQNAGTDTKSADKNKIQNNSNASDLRLYAGNSTGSNFRKIDYKTGEYYLFGRPEWRTIDAITSLGNYLYVISEKSLHRVDPSDGTWSLLGTINDWVGPAALTKSDDGYLYIVQNDRIHKVNPNNGDYTVIGQPEWRGVTSVIEYNSFLYLVENNGLYKVDKTTGIYTRLGNKSWTNTKGIASDGQGTLYIISDDYLHKVNSANGSFSLLNTQAWDNTAANGITFFNNSLYIIRNSNLYNVNTQNGSFVTLGNAEYNGTSQLTVL